MELRLQQGVANAVPFNYTSFAAEVRGIMSATGAKLRNKKETKKTRGASSKGCEEGGDTEGTLTWHDIITALRVLASLIAVTPAVP